MSLDAVPQDGRAAIREWAELPEPEVLARLRAAHAPDAAARARAVDRAAALVEAIRADGAPGLMESFLAEYGLSTGEGIALMCLAEALLRVPDAETMDALIEDKIAPSEWGAHLGHSASSLVNASTWALMLTGRVLREDARPGVAATLRGAVKRLGEPVIRTAVRRAMAEMGRQFVLGETIEGAMARAARMEAKGYAYSYDMLGEAARTMADADGFFDAYAAAIDAIRVRCGGDVRANPGISVKLSALHPRYEEPQRDRVMAEVVPRLVALARRAADANMGLNVDAEEADRLELSLDVIEAALAEVPTGWEGFGVVVQGYGRRAAPVIDWLHERAAGRRLMVRLVKGAYWDAEVKRAQVEGLAGFPTFTRKAATDVAFACCAAKLMGLRDRLYPQIATHNALTVAQVLQMGADPATWEFQRLHGMGEALHERVMRAEGTRCRIYAPVGAHEDLLAYLVRRLLENGANSSFVNRIVDAKVPAREVVADPFSTEVGTPAKGVAAPADLFAPRANSAGIDLHDRAARAALDAARAPFADAAWEAGPLGAAAMAGGAPERVENPAKGDAVGTVRSASDADVAAALDAAAPWAASPEDRAAALERAADLYEGHRGELFALLAREAGKTPPDAVSEVREAVDFLRFYAAEARRLRPAPRGAFACISPWNFPLAIFTGQVAAALAAGNAVLAKPAEATPLVAHRAVRLLHEAGVPEAALHLLPGEGGTVGAALASDPRVAGVAFTGSTGTAQAIHRAMAAHLAPDAPLVAETGGLNAMIVDSTALPEQAVRDVIASAFQSAGQRCSALRCLYVQEDVAARTLDMLFGAMDELRLGDPWDHATDVGPAIDAAAAGALRAYVEAAEADGRLLKRLDAPKGGHFVGPAVIRVGGIGDIAREVFGPVLHVATYPADDLDAVIDAINARGYGLTFGIHSRIDDRVEAAVARVQAGNLYVNRNQIGAIVGSQPFGGEGLSGTGPKAGGPHYVARFAAAPRGQGGASEGEAEVDAIRDALAAARPAPEPLRVIDLPGPTGESNRLRIHPRGTVLCLGPGAAAAAQAAQAREMGCGAVEVPQALDPAELETLEGFDVVAFWGAEDDARAIRRALAAREGPILPLATEADIRPRCVLERHVCVDTTAAGGNASLLAAAS